MNCLETILDNVYKKQLIATKFAVSVYEYILFESIRIAVTLFDDQNIIVDKKLYLLEGEEYSRWTLEPFFGNDEYLITWVKNRLQQEGNDN